MSNRRSFIKQSGFLTAGLMVNPAVLLKPKTQFGIQLYTLRDQISASPAGVLSKIAAAGYTKVETYGYGEGKFFGKTVKEFSQLLKANGLITPSGHYGLETLLFNNGNGDDLKELISVGNELGQKCIVIPHLKEEGRKTLDQYKKLAEIMNKAGELCKTGGMELGYHNHDFEFEPLEGSTGYDVFLKQTDPNLVKLEMDIYWVVRAGRDPLQMIKDHPGRFPMWHVKDMSKTNKDENTEVGQGSIDFKNIFKAARVSGLKHLYVEQESNYSPDEMGSILRSAEYLKKNFI